MAVYRAKYDRMAEPVKPYMDGPRVITLWASGRCNFKCRYCIHGGGKASASSGFPAQDMSWQTFLRIMDQIRGFRRRPDSIVFCGVGEPLLNDKLPSMVAYIKENSLATTVEMTSNGSLLSHSKSRALTTAGLDCLNISLQGVTGKMYQNSCGVPCQVDVLREQIAYFFQQKGRCNVHIKTVDACLNPGDEQVFFDLFSPICDTIHIDSVIPLFPEVDYGNLISQVKDQYTGETLVLTPDKSCRLLEFSLFVQPDGEVVPCCITPDPVKYGNIYQETLPEIWNGRNRKDFVELHRSGNRQNHPLCASCVQPDILG